MPTFDAVLPLCRPVPLVIQPAGGALGGEVEVVLEAHPPLAGVVHARVELDGDAAAVARPQEESRVGGERLLAVSPHAGGKLGGNSTV